MSHLYRANNSNIGYKVAIYNYIYSTCECCITLAFHTYTDDALASSKISKVRLQLCASHYIDYTNERSL